VVRIRSDTQAKGGIHVLGLKAIPLIYTAAAIAAAQVGPGFDFPDFSTPGKLNFVGEARRVKSVARLAPARQDTAGALWYPEAQNVARGFQTRFRFQLTRPDPHHFRGADGFAFVVQTSGPDVVAGQGGAGGFAIGAGPQKGGARGIPLSLAVFFDTWQNHEFKDPSGNYIAFCTNGDGYWPPRRLAYTRKIPINLKDGRVHTCRIVYRPPELAVYLEDSPKPVLIASIEMRNVTGPDAVAYVGFTASTGSGFQDHDLLSWSFGPLDTSESSMSVVTTSISFNQRPCLAERTLCTPDQAVVEDRGEGQFHVLLPANLEWGASIPNPGNREIAVSNLIGSICRAASKVCNDASPEDLRTATKDGRTAFSVKAPAGETFARNEGSLQFDVRLR
jgi:hypothetical protein